MARAAHAVSTGQPLTTLLKEAAAGGCSSPSADIGAAAGTDCFVYTFGIANEWTFEDWAGGRGCEIHAFDPTERYQRAHRAHTARNVHFHYMGLGARANGTAAGMRFWGYGRLGGPVLALAAPVVALAPHDPPPSLETVPPDGQVALIAPLPPQPGGLLDLAGWIQGEPPQGALAVELVSGETRRVLPVRVTRAEDGRFATFVLEEPVDATRLPLTAWSAWATVEGRGGRVRRPLAVFLSGDPAAPYADLGPWLLALAVLFAPGRGRWRWLALGAVLGNAWLVGATLLPLA